MPSQFIVGKDRESVAQAVKALGWRRRGEHPGASLTGLRSTICTLPNKSAVTSGDTVHIVGRASKEISALKFSGAIIVRL